MPTDTPAKPPTPDEQMERYESVVAGIEEARGPKKPAKLGAEQLTPEEQKRRFEELAREAGCDESSDAKFEAAVKALGKPTSPLR